MRIKKHFPTENYRKIAEREESDLSVVVTRSSFAFLNYGKS